jgi:hypothetical protein
MLPPSARSRSTLTAANAKKNTYGPKAAAGVAGHAAIRQSKGRVRTASRTGFEGHIVKHTVEYGVAGIRHEDLHYHKSTRKGFGPRMRHALVSTVVTHKTTNGKRTVASGRISGTDAGMNVFVSLL